MHAYDLAAGPDPEMFAVKEGVSEPQKKRRATLPTSIQQTLMLDMLLVCVRPHPPEASFTRRSTFWKLQLTYAPESNHIVHRSYRLP